MEKIRTWADLNIRQMQCTEFNRDLADYDNTVNRQDEGIDASSYGWFVISKESYEFLKQRGYSMTPMVGFSNVYLLEDYPFGMDWDYVEFNKLDDEHIIKYDEKCVDLHSQFVKHECTKNIEAMADYLLHNYPLNITFRFNQLIRTWEDDGEVGDRPARRKLAIQIAEGLLLGVGPYSQHDNDEPDEDDER